MRFFLQLLLFFSALFSLFSDSGAVDTLTPGQALRDNETLVSAGEMYELGFFSPGNSKNRYLGIWFKQIFPQTVAWVANRETPLNSTEGMLRVSRNGKLLLLSGNSTVIWSSGSSVSVGNNNVTAKLLNSGNFVVCDTDITNSSSDRDFIWQSFDYPTDTLLAGMKFGKDLVTGLDRRLTSWKSNDDPSPGLYVSWMDTNGYPQAFERRGSVLRLRFGPWTGVRFSGFPSKPNPIYTYDFIFNEKEVYSIFNLINSSTLSRVYLSPEGNEMRLNWIDPTQGWMPYLVTTVDLCTQYGLCGAYGICSMNTSPVCSCIKGFEPRISVQWNAGNWSGGCQREKPLNCGREDKYRKLSGVKLPDTRNSWYNISMNLRECQQACKQNCSCTGYGNMDSRNGGKGCLLWFGDLMDVREYNENQEIYIRTATSKLSGMKSHRKAIEVVAATMVGFVLVGLAIGVYVWKKKLSSTRRHGDMVKAISEDYTGGGQNKDLELPFFSFSELSKLTNNFSLNNKLGEGGFGAVYKGVMEDGREIAVKRLSETSTQGLDEFMNEVRCIHRLQHRNLVKLLGFCAQKNEIMLVYEYMSNRSLDTVLFDETQSLTLDWTKRFNIINGIARGLLYLHQDSRLRIIHRDLKAANILLDNDMNPKISDFGLARRFKGYDTKAKTKNVVGTYGYIPPEYAVHGIFSVKSDVFSFGVLVLEIVSGMKNREFSSNEHRDNLLGHAWRLYKDGKGIDLVSAPLLNSCILSEVHRTIHIGLLCVQNHAEDRPTMSLVALMLGNDGVLPQPKTPAFFTGPELDQHAQTTQEPSGNNLTVSLSGR